MRCTRLFTAVASVLTFTVVLATLPSTASAVDIDFGTSRALEFEVRRQLEIPFGPITDSDMLGITSIALQNGFPGYLWEPNMGGLTGLEYAANLDSLEYCGAMPFTDDLTYREGYDGQQHAKRSLTVVHAWPFTLSGGDSLEQIAFVDCYMSSYPLDPLEPYTNLKSLNVSYNNFSGLPSWPGLGYGDYIDVRHNLIDFSVQANRDELVRIYGITGGCVEYYPQKVNNPPVAHVESNTTAVTADGPPVEIPLHATDYEGDPVAYRVVTQPQHGTINVAGGKTYYTPQAGYRGSDSFTWVANDGQADSLIYPYPWSVTVAEVTPPPVVSTPASSSWSLVLVVMAAFGLASAFGKAWSFPTNASTR